MGRGVGERAQQARRRAPAARGVPPRRRGLRAALPREGRGVLGGDPQDRRRPETFADYPALMDFFIFVHLFERS